MIQIRNSIFETNSSSSHAFLFPKDANIKIPSTVVLYDTYDDTLDNMPNLYFNDCNWGEEYTTPFIKFLYKYGVKEIKYTGRHQYVTEAIDKYKTVDPSDITIDRFEELMASEENLLRICFDSGVKLKTLSDDWERQQKYVDPNNEYDHWCSYRLS